MKNVPTKATGDQLTAEEYNLGTNEELKNTVQSSGQTLSQSDLFQLAKTISLYVGSADFYVESGSANNYILSAIGSKQPPSSYETGLRMRFIPTNTNTGASIVNLATLGSLNIKTSGGIDPGAGAIVAGQIIELAYDGTNAIIYNTSVSGSEFSTGDAKITFKSVADAGWVMMDDGTIGSATSGASTRANADCEILFKLLWNNIIDAWAPVVTGRGASANADWTANKEITLPRQLGRALSVAGSGTGLTARVLAEYLGEEAHQLTIPELAAHPHDFSPANHTNTPGAVGMLWTGDGVAGTATTQSTGGDVAHNNMQPSAFWNVMLKL